MSAETIMRTIQLILAPVVMVSACAVFVGGLLSHYEAINARMRNMARERLELLRSSADGDRFIKERVSELDAQLPQLLRRHALVHHALLAAYSGILILVASMCAIAFSAVTTAAWLVALVLAMFVAGILAILISVVLIALEVRTSQNAVAFEVQRVLRLRDEPARVTRTTIAETVHP
jgi:Flp pilus assembly protein TadB